MAGKESRSATLVGAFILAGLLALGALIVQFGKMGDGLVDTYKVYVEYRDASGLIKGSDVRMGGAKVGVVSSKPELTEDLTVIVELKLNRRFRVYKGSDFMIQSMSLLGDKMIVIVPPETINGKESYVDGDHLKGAEAGGLDALQSDAESVARDARILMKDVRASFSKIDTAINDIRTVSGQLKEVLEKVNHNVLDEESLASIKRTVLNLEQSTSKFNSLGDDLKPVVKDAGESIEAIKLAANRAEETFDVAANQLKKLDPIFEKMPATFEEINRATRQTGEFMSTANKVMQNLNDKEGLFSMLTSDTEVSRDMKVFLKNLKHYGILRYKDEETYDPKDPKENRYRGQRR